MDVVVPGRFFARRNRSAASPCVGLSGGGHAAANSKRAITTEKQKRPSPTAISPQLHSQYATIMQFVMLAYELKCRCGWRTVCGRDDAIARLRLIGLLRREPAPEESVVATLLVEAAPRMTCPICKEKTLSATPANSAGDGDWLTAVLCEICRQPISPERLEALPGATRCARCQQKSEAGELHEAEPEYCPQCGALVEIRMSRGPGITRYKLVCTGNPPCRL
jgi:hypothetical protein